MAAFKEDPVGNLRESAKKFFEPVLNQNNLGTQQIEEQSLEELERSLELINHMIDHPEQFGVFKVKATATAFVISTDSHFELGILPFLLERKRLILERIAFLRGAQEIERIKDVIKETTDTDVQTRLVNMVSELQVEFHASLEKLRATERERIDAEVDQTVKLQRAAAETFQIKSKVWLSFLQRESMATLIGAVLLILITLTLISFNIFNKEAADILNNAFLVILGYFFGQAVGRTPAREDTSGI